MKISLIFAWFDLWIGFYWDKNKNWLYILPFPMVGIVLKFNKTKDKCDKGWHTGECCCNCRNHYEDFYHCTRKPKPEGIEGCVCSTHKGWICLVKMDSESKVRAHSNWSEHGFCELWLPK